MAGIKREHLNQKYNKINQQKKFHLLTLFHQRNYSLKKAAAQAGINYLTAKTIVFFHKKDHKSYQFNFENAKTNFLAEQTASYKEYSRQKETGQDLEKVKPTVEVICSTGNVVINPADETEGKRYFNPNAPFNKEQLMVKEKSMDVELDLKVKNKPISNPLAKNMMREEFMDKSLEEKIQMVNKLMMELQSMKKLVPDTAVRT